MSDNGPMGNPYAPKPPGTHPPVDDPQRHPADDPRGLTSGRARRGTPGGGARPPREPVDPEVMRSLTRPLITFTLLLLACLLLSSAPLPWRMGALALVVATLVAGGLTLRRVWQAKVRGTIVVAVAAGMAVSLTLGLATLAVIPVWDIEKARQTCLDEAITHSARSACLVDYEDALDEYQDSLTR